MDYVKIARDFKYKNRKGNLSLETWNDIKNDINPKMPIRPSKRWSPKDFEELTLDLQIFLAQYGSIVNESNNSVLAKDYLELLNNWSEENNTSTVKNLKMLEKQARLGNESLLLQSILSIHRGCDYYPSQEGFSQDSLDYVNHYMSEDKHPINNTYRFSEETLRFLCDNFIRNFSKLIKKDIRMYPPVSLRKSPLGDKLNDFKTIKTILNSYDLPTEIVENFNMINKTCLNLDIPEFKFTDSGKNLNELDNQVQIKNVMALSPKFSMIPSPGKLRPIFISNDVYDVILNPFRRMIKLFTNNLSSSYNSKKIINGEYLNVDIPDNVRKVHKSEQNLFNSGLVNSDLTAATDKIHSEFQSNLIIDLIESIYSLLTPEQILPMENLIKKHLGINNPKDYMKNCLDIISKSYISVNIDTDNGNSYGLLRPKFGQCQGQRGSFDSLHLIHTAVCLESVYKVKRNVKLDYKDLPFIVNGDDGVLPSIIEKEYSQLWIDNSDIGVKSVEKSTTVVTDHVEFCKQLVRFNPNTKQPLNGLKFKSLTKLMSNPSLLIQMEDRYDTSDMWKQIRLLNKMIQETETFLPIVDSIVLNIPQENKKQFLKTKSLLMELLAKHAIQVTNDPNVEFVRNIIDKEDSLFNVFDREVLLPSKDYSSAEDWSDRYGIISISNKFDLDLEGFTTFNVDEQSYNISILNQDISSEILSLAIATDIDIYHQLMGVINKPTLQRRVENLTITMLGISPHKLLIHTDYIKSELLF